MPIGAIFSLLTGSGLLSRAIQVGLLVITLAGAYTAWHHKVFEDGREYERGLIAADNEEAKANARALKSTYQQCTRGGADLAAWDRLTSRCLR